MIDKHPARPSELLPFRDEVAVLVEDLDAVVGAIAHEKPPLGIERQRMRAVELALARALVAPFLDEFTGLRKLHDAIVIAVAGVTVRDEDIAVRSHHHVGR